LGIVDEEGGEFFLGDFYEVCGVRAIVATDDEEEVHRLLEHVKEGVLALLGGATDGVEHLKILAVAITLFDGGEYAFLYFFGFAFEHGCLVSDTDFLHVDFRIESF